LGTITALVGENNSGKSAIVRALNCFFNYVDEIVSFENGEHFYRNGSIPKIEIRFTEVPSRKEFNKYSSSGAMTIEFRYDKKNEQRVLSYRKSGSFTVLSSDETRAFMKGIKTVLRYVYIPPNRDKSKYQWIEETILHKVVAEYLKTKSSKKDFFTKPFLEAARNLERRALNPLSSEFSSYYGLSDNLEFEIGFQDNINYENFLHDILLMVKEHDHLFKLSYCGTGIQSIAIIALHLYYSKMLGGKIIVGLEEPETNLHPQAQSQLIKFITDEVDKSGQFIMTTHSTRIIDAVGHEDIALIRKIEDPVRGFYSTISKLQPNFFSRNNITPMKYYGIFNLRNSEIFYCKKVILLEGDGDLHALYTLARKENVDFLAKGISVFKLDGIDRLKYGIYLLKELNIPFYLICDKDFFLEYSNGDLKTSRFASGLPSYKKTFKTSSKVLIGKLIPNLKDRNDIESKLTSNHGQALDVLEKYNIICMNYTTDIDLACSKAAQTKLYSLLNLQTVNQNKRFLLIDRRRKIKDPGIIKEVLESIKNTSLPTSLKRVRKLIKTF
jgi:predicted ATP-dependent endonuclease of OLD family